MRAALIEAIGRPPAVREVPEPRREQGQALVEVTAAPLNPIDLAIAAGRFYEPPSELPYIAGKEGVGRVLEGDALAPGRRVYFPMPGGLGGAGSFCERATPAEARALAVPEGVSDAPAACLGVAGLAAWLGLALRARLQQGESVLILGASGAVGQIAVQAAKLLGAGTVVAAARDRAGLERARGLGADSTVELAPGSSAEELGAAVVEAAGGAIDVALDPLWGAAVAVAVESARPGGRIVHLGQSAGAEARLRSAPIRGKALTIIGHATQATPRDAIAEAYARLVGHAAEGRLDVDHEVLPLDEVAEAWERQAAHPRRKLVLRP